MAATAAARRHGPKAALDSGDLLWASGKQNGTNKKHILGRGLPVSGVWMIPIQAHGLSCGAACEVPGERHPSRGRGQEGDLTKGNSQLLTTAKKPSGQQIQLSADVAGRKFDSQSAPRLVTLRLTQRVFEGCPLSSDPSCFAGLHPAEGSCTVESVEA